MNTNQKSSSKSKLYAICFSGSGTTEKYLDMAVDFFLDKYPKFAKLNIADHPTPPATASDDLLIVAVPVYGGRIPSMAADYLKKLNGNNCKTIAITIFGNREYDDALLELSDLLIERDCILMGAGAFVARHSIFPKVASDRPDTEDATDFLQFCHECYSRISSGETPRLRIKGNHPYKKGMEGGFLPTLDKKQCQRCGICASKCPTGAINTSQPWIVDSKKCISCGRCIRVCPLGIRRHKGLKYNLISAVFGRMTARRHANEWF